MIYAELINERIEDRGVFFTLEEFLPFRAKGWMSTPEINAAADFRLAWTCLTCGTLKAKAGYTGCGHGPVVANLAHRPY